MCEFRKKRVGKAWTRANPLFMHAPKLDDSVFTKPAVRIRKHAWSMCAACYHHIAVPHRVTYPYRRRSCSCSTLVPTVIHVHLLIKAHALPRLHARGLEYRKWRSFLPRSGLQNFDQTGKYRSVDFVFYIRIMSLALITCS